MSYIFAAIVVGALIWIVAGWNAVHGEYKTELHVYCTNCIHLHMSDEDVPYCPFEDKCDITDFEDSKDIEKRPCYWNKRKHGF